MKVIIEDVGPDGEEELILRCREVDERLMRLINRVKAGNQFLNAQKDGKWFRLSPGEIYYIEAVDNRVYLYAQKEVYESRNRLYELEGELGPGDFFRISKSVIVNLSKIKSLTPAFSGRLEAVLKNGEKVIISRQYVARLKEVLGL